jgi:hypothetical protein
MAASAGNKRAIMWALAGAGAIGVYFFVLEPGLDIRAVLQARADALAATLAEVQRGAGAAQRDAQTVSLGRRQYGHVALPGDPRERPIEFNRRIAEALREAQVASHESRSRAGSVARGPYQATLEEGERLESVITEIEFQATPEQVSQVVAALELCEEVSAITRIDLDRAPEGERALSVTLSVETWIVSRGAQR